MSEGILMQRAYTSVLRHFIEHGRAPHYVELARILDIEIDEARVLIKDTAAAAPIASCWLSHDTDYIESWAPFSNVPTHIRISVDGMQKWYGQ
ncbi:MAG: hypothetical protein JSV42_09880 [Chloroflexota bacterium]|nr:MAG: hypothetical protein JSV42_09880 [Chloroflexota bacterium]